MKIKLIAIILLFSILVVFTRNYYVIAITKSELNNQNRELDSQIDAKKDEISNKEQEISSTMKEVQTLINQISSYEEAIKELDTQINDLSSRIDETQKDITGKEKDIQEKQELLDNRLVALYESGNTSYLEMLLTSTDLSEFISKYYLISEIAQCDTELISSIKKAKEELETAKANLENDKKSVETAKSEQVKKREELKNAKAEKEKKAANLSAEEKALEDELERYEADKRQVQAKLEEIARKEREEEERRKREAAEAAKKNQSSSSSGSSSGTSSSPSSYGYIFPVQGLSKANINNLSYPSYPGHTGVDVNIGVIGKNVVAVKSGTVVISDAFKIGNSYYSYGEYVSINHHDGTITLYAHMAPGSRKVKEGDKVSQGQVIGTVGNTGKVSPKPTASNPNAGTHLHFEVRVNR